MGWDGRRVVVTGLPAFVAMPSPGSVKTTGTEPEEDTALSDQTRSAATAFFTAYAGSDTNSLQAAAAPGARVEPLGGAVEYTDLTQWSVLSGDTGQKTRSAHATVTWSVNGAQLTQEYDVRLAAVSSGTGTAWRVISVSATNPSSSANEGATS